MFWKRHWRKTLARYANSRIAAYHRKICNNICEVETDQTWVIELRTRQACFRNIDTLFFRNEGGSRALYINWFIWPCEYRVNFGPSSSVINLSAKKKLSNKSYLQFLRVLVFFTNHEVDHEVTCPIFLNILNLQTRKIYVQSIVWSLFVSRGSI
jgi:hypothetical protein